MPFVFDFYTGWGRYGTYIAYIVLFIDIEFVFNLLFEQFS